MPAATSNETQNGGERGGHQQPKDDFEALGLAIMNRENSRAGQKSRMRRFKSWFGMEPVFASLVWRMLHESGRLKLAGKKADPRHLLWACMWLKGYFTEDVGAAMAGVDEKTFREKVWFYVEAIARLDSMVVCHWVLLGAVDRCQLSDACFLYHLTIVLSNSFFA